MNRGAQPPVVVWIAAGVVFALLLTANGGGYRYGSADQAFYIPAVTRALDPAAFPRDAPLIDAEARLMVVDEVIAATAKRTGASVPWLFFGGYVLLLAVTWAGLVLIGTHVYRSPWAVVALGAAFTLRHRIALTSANSFEPYFHPRMLAFGIGLIAVAAFLRHRAWTTIALVGLSALVHVTTALWFAVALGTALAVLDRRWRLPVIAATAGVAAALAWAVIAGPLQQAAAVMDETWLRAVSGKDSLFANEWPLWAWLTNLGLLALLWSAIWRRRRTRTVTPEDEALAWGATMLVGVFLATLPAVASHVSLAVEFQISRIFWLVDVFALVYVIAAIADGPRRLRAAPILAGVLMTISLSRAIYVIVVEHPERGFVAITTPESPWEDAMRWIARQPIGVHVLADPGHFWKYGTSVRESAGRDVFLEDVKDSAVAIYSHDVAARVVERTTALGDFDALTADHAYRLASQYRLDYLVTVHDLPLPLAYRNQEFRIYRINQP